MRAGLPCVATRVGGIPGVVTDRESGLLVEPANPEALAAALEAVFADPAAAGSMGEGARTVVRERFEMSTVAAAYAGIYDELVGRGAPASETAGASG